MGKIPERYQLLKSYIQGKRVLHIGCVGHDWRRSLGTNWIHHYIVKYAESSVGMDCMRDAVKKLSQNGFNMLYGDAEDFNLGSKFDTIFAGELIEHLEDFRGFFESCKKHMNADSKLILTTPNSFGARYIIMNLLNRQHVNPEHVCIFDSATLKQLLGRHGFEVETVRYISLDKDFSGKVKGFFLRQFERLPRSKPVLFVVAKIRNAIR